MDNKVIYLDNSSTTKVDTRVVDAMLPVFTKEYGNPSSINYTGVKAYEILSKARQTVADFINAAPQEIIFMGSGSESDTFAIIQGCLLRPDKKHIITTAVEHKAVLNTTEYLAENGYEVTYLPVDSECMISVEELKNAIRPDTCMISVMMANNEVGTIMPVKEIGQIAKEKGILYHVDAVQAAGKVPIDVDELNADFLTITGHKIYAPKGVGILYVKEEHKPHLKAYIHGGGQEYGLRAGTENVPYIVGLAKAMEILIEDNFKEAAGIAKLRDLFEKRILAEIPFTKTNGCVKHRVGSISNITFKYIEAEAVIGYVPEICCSLGSACSAKSEAASHVLTAMGIDRVDIRGSIRFSLGRYNTEEEVNRAVELLKMGISKLREMSPLYNTIKK